MHPKGPVGTPRLQHVLLLNGCDAESLSKECWLQQEGSSSGGKEEQSHIIAQSSGSLARQPEKIFRYGRLSRPILI